MAMRSFHLRHQNKKQNIVSHHIFFCFGFINGGIYIVYKPSIEPARYKSNRVKLIIIIGCPKNAPKKFPVNVANMPRRENVIAKPNV